MASTKTSTSVLELTIEEVKKLQVGLENVKNSMEDIRRMIDERGENLKELAEKLRNTERQAIEKGYSSS